MALAHDDIWQKFDLFIDEKVTKAGEFQLTGRQSDWSAGQEWGPLPEPTTVPDISDFLFDFGASENCENLGEKFGVVSCDRNIGEVTAGVDSPGCPGPGGEQAGLAGEALRHDCMWSGLCPSEEHITPRSSGRHCRNPDNYLFICVTYALHWLHLP